LKKAWLASITIIFTISTLMISGTAQNASAGAAFPSVLFEFGTFGSGDGEFAEVRGVAVDNSNGHIIVADRDNDRIQVFDSAGAFLFEFDGSSGADNCSDFDEPKGVAVDGSGNIYVTDFLNDLIQKYDSTGTCILSFDAGDAGGCPRDVAVAISGNIIVLDECNREVDVYNAAGAPLFSFDGTTGGGNEFREPKAVAVDSSDKIYVTDRPADNVNIFDSSGSFLRMFGWGVDTGASNFEICTSGTTPCQGGIEGPGVGQFSNPRGIEVGSTGIIYVADEGNERIQLFDSSGNFLAEIGSFGTGLGEFDQLRDVAVDTCGKFYVSDDGDFRSNDNNRIQVFDTGILLCPVGGELIPLDSTMVLVAGTQTTAAWMIPVIVSAIGIGIVIARKF